MTDLATRLHEFDMASKRGSHHADGLNRFRDIVAGPLAETLALAESYRKDAERYRWLRDVAYNMDGIPFIARRNEHGVSQWIGKPADAAIDAALGTHGAGESNG